MTTRLLAGLIASTAMACVFEKESEQHDDDVLDKHQPGNGGSGATRPEDTSGPEGWSDEGGGSTGGGPDTDDIGDMTGMAMVIIQELDCDIIWDMSGTHCAGCGLEWDTLFSLSSSGSCEFGTDTSATFEVISNAAYMNDDYWGQAIYGSGSIYFYTVGYVAGAGGYSYYYAGFADY